MQKYSEYLEDEKDMKYVEAMEKQESQNKTKEEAIQKQQVKPKQKVKLSYKEQKEYEALPDEIDTLEAQIETINNCLANPDCYQEKGIVAISKELEEITNEYDMKLERYIELEELMEQLQD